MKLISVNKRGYGQGVRGHAAISGLFLFVFACVLVVLFFLRTDDYPCRKEYPANLLLLAGVVPGLLVISAVPFRGWRIWDNYSKRKQRVCIGFLVGILFLVQLYSVYCYFFYTNWDVGELVSASRRIAHGEELKAYDHFYFSTYANNRFLLFLFSGIIRLVNVFFPQTMDSEAEYMMLLAVQCAVNLTTGMLIYIAAKWLFQRRRYAAISYGLYVLLLGFSPWVSIPYSDSMSLVFPIAIFTLYLCPVKTNRGIVIKWISIAVLVYIGYSIKPQTAILFFAVVIIKGLSIRRDWLKDRRKKICAGTGLVAGLCCTALFVNLAVSSLPIKIDRESQFGPSHYLMMGFNPETKGGYSEDDYVFSKGIQAKKERDAENLRIALKRIRSMGFSGVMWQFQAKTLSNFNDGTFAWGNEGKFFLKLREKPDHAYAMYLKELFQNTENEKLWSYPVQGIWIGVLFFAFFSGLRFRKNDPVLMLSLVGLTVFELLFESRARYLLTFVPLFILLATSGLQYANDRAKRHCRDKG